jgi:hypothetical protein
VSGGSLQPGWARWLAPGAIAAGAIATYLSVLAVPYAFEDDYWNLGFFHGLGGVNVWKYSVQDGRPIHALLLLAAFSAVPDIDSLRLLRLVGLAGVVLLGLMLSYALRRAGTGRWLSAGVATSVICLPSFQVYVSWATLFEAPYAAMLGGTAALLVSSAFGRERRAALVRQGAAATVLLCALLIYQPCAMFFWVFAAIDLLRPRERLSRALKRCASYMGVAIVALMGGYFAVRVGVHFYGYLGNGRSTVVRDIGRKLGWFWNQPLLNALNLFKLVPRWWLAAAVATVAGGGILLLHARKRWEALGFLGIAAGLVPLAYLPNLVIAEEWASYRSLGALSALVAVYLWLGLWGIGRTAVQLWARSDSRSLALRAAGLAISLAIVVTAVILGARNVTTLFAETQNAELKMVRSTLESPSSPPHRVVFIKPSLEGAAPFHRYDEFGYPSSYAPWVPVPAVLLILRERHLPFPAAIDVLAWDQVGAQMPHKPGTLVVDMRKLREHQVNWTFFTLHGAKS